MILGSETETVTCPKTVRWHSGLGFGICIGCTLNLALADCVRKELLG